VRFLEARSAPLNQVIFDFQTQRGIVDSSSLGAVCSSNWRSFECEATIPTGHPYQSFGEVGASFERFEIVLAEM
jgi:hypothetical protein